MNKLEADFYSRYHDCWDYLYQEMSYVYEDVMADAGIDAETTTMPEHFADIDASLQEAYRKVLLDCLNNMYPNYCEAVAIADFAKWWPNK